MTHPKAPARLAAWTLILAACLVTQSGQRVEAQGQLVLKVGTSAAPESPWGHMLQRFENHVRQRTQGRIRVRVFYEATLGNDAQQVEKLIAGSLQGYVGPVDALLPAASPLRVLSLPYLFDSDKPAMRALTTATEPASNIMLAAGIHFGAWQPFGFRSWFATHAIASERDLADHPTEATLIEAAQRGLHLRAQHVTLSRHAYTVGALVYSQRWFAGLPAQTQETLVNLPPEITTQTAEELASVETRLLEGMKQRGGQVHELDATQSRVLARSFRASNETALRGFSEQARALYRTLRPAQ